MFRARDRLCIPRDELDVSLKEHGYTKCDVCGRTLLVQVEIVVEPINRTFLRTVKVEDFERVTYMVVGKPSPYPPDIYSFMMCRSCYMKYVEYLDALKRRIMESAETYSATVIDGADRIIEFSNSKELLRFVEQHAMYVTEPAIEEYTCGNAWTRCYGLALRMVPRKVPEQASTPSNVARYPVLELVLPVTAIVEELKKGQP